MYAWCGECDRLHPMPRCLPGRSHRERRRQSEIRSVSLSRLRDLHSSLSRRSRAQYAYPLAATTLETVRVMLEAWSAAGASAPRLVVVSAEGVPSSATQSLLDAPDALSHSVHALASFGIEAWFAALAWGATQVVLVAGAHTPQASLHALRDEIDRPMPFLPSLASHSAESC